MKLKCASSLWAHFKFSHGIEIQCRLVKVFAKKMLFEFNDVISFATLKKDRIIGKYLLIT